MREKANGYDAEAVRSAMRRVAAHKFRSNREWAAKAGIGEATLWKFMSGGSQAIELDKLMVLARAADMKVSQMVGEVPPDSGDATPPAPAEDPAMRSLLREVLARLSRQTADMDALVVEFSLRLDKDHK
jgi:DNA-binding Xre family transcriptional regulator